MKRPTVVYLAHVAHEVLGVSEALAAVTAHVVTVVAVGHELRLLLKVRACGLGQRDREHRVVDVAEVAVESEQERGPEAAVAQRSVHLRAEMKIQYPHTTTPRNIPALDVENVYGRPMSEKPVMDFPQLPCTQRGGERG